MANQQYAELNQERRQLAEEAIIECMILGVSDKSLDALLYECGISSDESIGLIDEALKILNKTIE